MLTRRSLLGNVAVSAAAFCLPACKLADTPIPGRLIGAPAALGHRLREGKFPAPSATRKVDVVVAGGGISGLSAARQLKRSGVGDLLVLEAADLLGGNSASGQNTISAYPWGAHYVPLVRNDDSKLLALFREMNIITGFDADLPVYNDYFLSADPQERLFAHGRWQEGLVPNFGINEDDRAQYQRFFALVAELKTTKGSDGKPAFAIPIANSSADEMWRALDRITMADFLSKRGFTSRQLTWYVNYCCRDDYGATAANVSAWAGLHYFASRNGRAANASSTSVVTWPEGNGFFVHAWSRELANQIETNALVFAATSKDGAATIDYFDAKTERSVRVEARAAILALPSFVLRRIWADATKPSFEYSPWMVANISLDRQPEGHGMELAWDNVIQDSEMLGYVVADHQTVGRRKRETVITYYWPLSHTDAPTARNEALARTHFDWQKLVTGDLFRVHPELVGHVTQFDVMVWGHGMRRPTPGSLFPAEKPSKIESTRFESRGPFFLAHSDKSGISIFEEAFHNGSKAAESCRDYLAKRTA